MKTKTKTKTPTLTVDPIDLQELAPDQQSEIEQHTGLNWECYRWTRGSGESEADRGTAIYTPDIGRAGVCTNGDSVWVDADSITQAINRATSSDPDRWA